MIYTPDAKTAPPIKPTRKTNGSIDTQSFLLPGILPLNPRDVLLRNHDIIIQMTEIITTAGGMYFNITPPLTVALQPQPMP